MLQQPSYREVGYYTGAFCLSRGVSALSKSGTFHLGPDKFGEAFKATLRLAFDMPMESLCIGTGIR